MKRITTIIISLFIVLLLTVSLAACGGSQNADGTYKLTGMTIDGVDGSKELSSYPEDNIPTMVISGNTATLKNLLDENYTTVIIDFNAKTMAFEGETYATFERSGDKITINAYDGAMILEYTKQ